MHEWYKLNKSTKNNLRKEVIYGTNNYFEIKQ